MKKIFGKLRGDIPPDRDTPVPASGDTENIRLDTAADMFVVRALIHVLQDNPDSARDIIRCMSPRDRAVLSFDLSELSRLVSEEEDIRVTADRRRAGDMSPAGEDNPLEGVL